MMRRLCLIGVGLIGGSFALAARQNGLFEEVVGVDVDANNLAEALRCGIVDRVAERVEVGVADADAVVLAVPVGAMPSVFAALRPVWRDDQLVTDMGSTKLDVIEAIGTALGGIPPNFVPGHPIAGAERSGAGAADAGLFKRKRVILTPLPETDAAMLARVEALWAGVGARVSIMAPRHHDEILAATSHLPHVLAFVLTEMLGRKDEQREIFQYAAGGFRDFTRIASSDPRMWLDICLANQEQIVPLIQDYRSALQRAAELIETGDAASLLALFTSARDARQRFLNQLEKQDA